MIARTATLRFSVLGLASVATLMITGLVNAFYLVGSVAALLGTDYGRLLAVKVALFVVMVAIAAINRFRLTPELVPELRRLRRNAVVEIVLGAVIIAIVAKLGVTPPAFEQETMPHAHHHAH